MKDGYNCVRCGTHHRFTAYIVARWTTPQNHRCHRCGASHAILRGEVEVITPPVAPLDTPGQLSMWFLSESRPLQPGWYDGRFRNIEPTFVRLYWTGTHFQPSPTDLRVVEMSDFMGWRGILI